MTALGHVSATWCKFPSDRAPPKAEAPAGGHRRGHDGNHVPTSSLVEGKSPPPLNSASALKKTKHGAGSRLVMHDPFAACLLRVGFAHPPRATRSEGKIPALRRRAFVHGEIQQRHAFRLRRSSVRGLIPDNATAVVALMRRSGIRGSAPRSQSAPRSAHAPPGLRLPPIRRAIRSRGVRLHRAW